MNSEKNNMSVLKTTENGKRAEGRQQKRWIGTVSTKTGNKLQRRRCMAQLNPSTDWQIYIEAEFFLIQRAVCKRPTDRRKLPVKQWLTDATEDRRAR